MTETKTIEAELDERHAIARTAFLNRDVAAYRALFSPALAYHQVDGRVIDRRQLMRDVASQFRRRLNAKWHLAREHLKIDLDEAAETLIQLVTVEMSALGLIHRTWQLNRRAVYVWTEPGGVWTIGRVHVLSEEGKHLGWRFGITRR